MNHNRLFVKIILVSFLSINLITLLANYIIDPLQYFRPLEKLAKYQSSVKIRSRYLSSGAIKFREYDALITGSCLVQNFSYDKMYDLLKVRVLNLGTPSLSLKEQNYIVNQALKSQQKIKSIYWSLEFQNFGDDLTNEFNGRLPLFLYNKNISFDLIKIYLLNFKYVIKSIKMMYQYTIDPKKSLKYDYLEYFNKWPKTILAAGPYKISDKDRQIIYQNYHNLLELPYKLELNISKIEKVSDITVWKTVFRKNILSVVIANPNVDFNFIFVPYSILSFTQMYCNEKQFFDVIAMKIWLVEELSKYPNVKIFDFTASKEIVLDINNYVDKFNDSIHYKPAINDYMIESMAKEKYKIDKNNVNQFINDQLILISDFVKTL